MWRISATAFSDAMANFHHKIFRPPWRISATELFDRHSTSCGHPKITWKDSSVTNEFLTWNFTFFQETMDFVVLLFEI
jgi:hypothetical protein